MKQGYIVSELRRRVVEGLLAPGTRLPTRRELETHFSASLGTVQKALDELVRDGFIYAHGSRGTFVSENPPHLNHYGLIFPRYPKDGNFLRLWAALATEAMNLDLTQALRVHAYYGMDGHSDTPEYQRLVKDVESNRLGGLIFSANPFQLAGTPLLDTPNLPRVAIMSRQDESGLPVVGSDTEMFFRRAAEYFAARSRRKLGIISVTPLAAEGMAAAAVKCGLTVKPHWSQCVSLYAPGYARGCAHLLMNPDQTDRPDALVIGDDNLVEPATAGLIAAGVRIPEDVEVIGHSNFPYSTPSGVPVKRLGYDAREVLRSCLESIQRQRSGERCPAPIMVPAIFEDEVR